MEAFIAEHGVEEKRGIRELLAHLKEKGIPCAITSSSSIPVIRCHLGNLGLLDGFTALCSGKATEYPDGVSPKKKQLAAYLIENPGVSNKSYIARQLGMDVSTVRRYYDEVRAELAALACNKTES